ncbi:MAG TPA: hypothetical protein VFZ65_08740 [Planctomycetota bacterium]|nr:hypothetical protein [Planctomycetota bacterium]
MQPPPRACSAKGADRRRHLLARARRRNPPRRAALDLPALHPHPSGKHDFVSVEHFHAFVALAGTAGQDTEIVVLRDGARHVLHYALPE